MKTSLSYRLSAAYNFLPTDLSQKPTADKIWVLVNSSITIRIASNGS